MLLNKLKKKLQGFKNGAGTILFFEDQQVVKKLQADFPLYADAFPFFFASIVRNDPVYSMDSP